MSIISCTSTQRLSERDAARIAGKTQTGTRAGGGNGRMEENTKVIAMRWLVYAFLFLVYPRRRVREKGMYADLVER